jgi:hypothetical protein
MGVTSEHRSATVSEGTRYMGTRLFGDRCAHADVRVSRDA